MVDEASTENASAERTSVDETPAGSRRKRRPAESTAARELVEHFRNEVIRASAGTGKTFALSNRYLTLLASGVESQTILATTFTKKGAGEILDRIVQRLSAAAMSDENAELLSEQLDFRVTRERAASLLHGLLRNLHRLEIGTLDSFFNKIARAFSLELGLPPVWDVVEEQQMDELRYLAISEVLRGEAVIDLLHLLAKGEIRRTIDSQIYDTVSSVYRVGLQSTAEDWNRLPPCDTFLNEEQLAQIIDAMETVPIRQKRVHEFWLKLAGLIRTENWKEATATAFIQNVLDGNPRWSRSKLEPPVLAIIEKLIRHLRAVVTDRLIKQNTTTYALIERYRNLLEPLKNERGMLRFDDITDRLNEFVDRPDTSRLAFRLDQQIQHLLLDEFQDTSPAQWAVIRPFAKNLTEIDDAERSFFCVGDLKQAIFGWRGGVAEIFGLVEDELDNLRRGAPLLKSYRSSGHIIDVVNEVFTNLEKFKSDRPEVDRAVHDWGQYFSPHETAKDLQGHVTIEMAPDASDVQKRNTRSRESLDWPRNRNMYDLTVKRVCQLVDDLPPGTKIGVLARTNDVVSTLIFKLQQAGVQASEEGGTALTDSAAVNLVLSAMQLADYPGDSVARFHVSHSPLGGLFDLEPESAENQKQNINAVHRGAARLRKQLINDGYGPTVESLARLLMENCTERELLRLQHLIRFAYAGATDAARWSLRPGQFVRFIQDELKVADKSSADVRVMSIHKSKGLEFDVVVLPVKHVANGWTGRAPAVVVGRPTPTDPIDIASRYANVNDRKLLPVEFQELFENDRQREIREAMCVLYVGMTRAVHATHVILTHGAKKEHQSAGGVLLSTLDLKREEGLIYEHGNRKWFEDPSFTQKPAEDEDDQLLSKYYLVDSVASTADAVPLKTRSNRGQPRTSPSRLVGGNRVAVSSIFRTAEQKEAMQRGTLIHGCFELIHWLDDGMPSKEAIEGKLLELDAALDDKSLKSIVDEFYGMLDRPAVSCLLKRQDYLSGSLSEILPDNAIVMDAYRVEADNERPFAVSLPEGMLQGFIDRLVLVHEAEKLVAADIIDFKTDPVDPAGVAEKVAHYSPQLGAYRRAIAAVTGLPLTSVGCQLAFVSSGLVQRLAFDTDNGSSADATDSVPAKQKAETGLQKSVPPPKMQPGSKKQMRLWTDDV